MVHDEISTESLAAVLGLTPQRIGQLTHSGVFVKAGHGRYSLPNAVQAYVNYKVAGESRRLAGAADGEPTTPGEQVKLERARKLRLENDERERALTDTSNAIAALDVIVGMLRADLAGVPARVTDDVPLRRQIEHAIDHVLGGLADRFTQASADLRAGRDPDAADAADEPGPVGQP
jgi:phage terminase Nu1 subunit (DNA packaging protein)